VSEAILHVEELSLSFPNEGISNRVLDRVTFDIFPNEVLGLVGESGSGKTVTSLAIIQLLPPSAQVEAGRITFEGVDLLSLDEGDKKEIRGTQIAMIFQSPRAALNPIMRVGAQVSRALRLRQELSRTEAHSRSIELLQRVGIPDAETRAKAYPHQLSGGMAQRVLVALMLACRPSLLIADEPTTGLDVTIQAQIFELIKDIQAEIGTTMLLITHDLGVVSEMCTRVAVMYAGQIMEIAPVKRLFSNPSNPYTEMLLSSVLRVDQAYDLGAVESLPSVRIDYESSGCRYANRCPYVMDHCWERRPKQTQIESGHLVFCHKFSDQAT
jgi:oligopeptide/dipeptide ABC transporter ATP-binding protein